MKLSKDIIQILKRFCGKNKKHPLFYNEFYVSKYGIYSTDGNILVLIKKEIHSSLYGVYDIDNSKHDYDGKIPDLDNLLAKFQPKYKVNLSTKILLETCKEVMLFNKFPLFEFSKNKLKIQNKEIDILNDSDFVFRLDLQYLLNCLLSIDKNIKEITLEIKDYKSQIKIETDKLIFLLMPMRLLDDYI